MNKLITIILPTYNRAYIIERAIQSVINQSYIYWELIVVDDCSDDNTRQVVESFQDKRIRFFENDTNKGANFSRNYGSSLARGEYLAFLDSDNYWESNKLEKQVKLISESDEDVAFVFCRERVESKDVYLYPNDDFDLSDLEQKLFKYNLVDTSTILIKRNIFNKVGGFDNNIPRLQDWELVFSIIIFYKYKAMYISDVLNTNVIQKNSISKSNVKYYDALIYLIKKYKDNFSNENILWTMFYDTLGMAKNKTELLYFVNKFMTEVMDNNLVDNDLWIDSIIRIYREKRYYKVLYNWKKYNEQSSSRSVLFDYLKNKKNIAIYGLGAWGELIYNELCSVDINIVCGIDKQISSFHGINVILPNEKIENVDIIIVSIFQNFEEVKESLSKYYQGEIVSIEDIINEE